LNTKYLLVIAITILTGAGAASADERTPTGHVEPYASIALTKPQLETRINSINLLIESSSVARQAALSVDPAASERRQRARDHLAQATAALKKGDLPKTAQLLNEATKEMFECARITAPKSVGDEKKRKDFSARLDSVSALRDALIRVSAEKNLDSRTSETIAKVDPMVLDAKIAAPVDIDHARALLDKAYSMVKLEVEALREGDTLVRSLKFDSKADEYRYELDRNDTHQMLVTLLLKEERKVPSVDTMVSKAVKEAARLRSAAEEARKKGDFDAAVDALEKSTDELVRAIRAAGVDIPS
jgi:hypothetical protein